MRKKTQKTTFNDVTAKSQGRPNLVHELQQREHRPPCQSTALAVLPQFSALSNPSTCRFTTTGVPTSPRTVPEESRRTSAQFALCTCLCEATAPPLRRRTEAEAPPRTRRKPAGTELRGHRDDTTASATVEAASICIPPWPGGGELLKQSSCFPPPQGLHGHDCKSTTGSRRHFHQLFRQLRSPEQRSLRDGVLANDRGHFDNLLGKNRQ